MNDHERTQRQIRERKSLAAPLTKKVLRFSSVCYLLSLIICIGAFYHQVLMPYGIHTHPPSWVFVLAHIVAILAALTSAYSAMYLYPVKRKWLVGAVTAALCYATTLGAIAWGIPNLSVRFGAEPVTQEAEIYGAADLNRKRTVGCRKKVMFGPWYAPGGSACYNVFDPSAMIGSTMFIEGFGNGWATRITSIERTYRRSAE